MVYVKCIVYKVYLYTVECPEEKSTLELLYESRILNRYKILPTSPTLLDFLLLFLEVCSNNKKNYTNSLKCGSKLKIFIMFNNYPSLFTVNSMFSNILCKYTK